MFLSTAASWDAQSSVWHAALGVARCAFVRSVAAKQLSFRLYFYTRERVREEGEQRLLACESRLHETTE